MKWISLIGLLVCGSVNAQSVICERYGALPGEPQQTFDRRCPAGYKEVGQVGGSSRSSGYIPDSLAENLADASLATIIMGITISIVTLYSNFGPSSDYNFIEPHVFFQNTNYANYCLL